MEAIFKNDVIQENATFLGSSLSLQLNRFVDLYLGFLEVGIAKENTYSKNLRKGYLSKTGTVPVIIIVNGDHSESYSAHYLNFEIPNSEFHYSCWYELNIALKKAVDRKLISKWYLKYTAILPSTRIEHLVNNGWEKIDDNNFKNLEGVKQNLHEAYTDYVSRLVTIDVQKLF